LQDYEDTTIYGGLNEHIDWTIFAEAAAGKIEYVTLQIRLKKDKVLKKDLVTCPGCLGLMSEKFLDYFDDNAFVHFALFNVFVNDVPYTALFPKQSVDCLNPKLSQFTSLSSTDDLWHIHKYSIDFSVLPNSIFFSIPQSPNMLYCTQDLGRMLLAKNLAVEALPLVKVEDDLSAKIKYDNPVFGLSFQEPKNWFMSGEQIQKIRDGKTIPTSAWKTAPTKKDDALLLFEMQRFEFLQSDDWRQKAEIYVQLVNQTPEQLFEQRSAITPIEIKHPDLKFEARKNEYEWERCLMAPYQNDTWWLIIVITRNEDPRFLKEALEVVQQIRFNNLA
jgi:hypothetical protein